MCANYLKVESSIIASDLSDSSNESLLLSSGGSNRNALNDDNEEMANSLRSNDAPKRKRTGMSARERNLRRLESNERERLRMHGLNAAFEVVLLFFFLLLFKTEIFFFLLGIEGCYTSHSSGTETFQD